MNASFRILTCLLVGLSCLLGGSAWAQPPGKGGGGGGGGSANNGGGVIYFTYSATSTGGQLYQMNDDGSGVTALPIPTSQLGSPSYQLHAGYRWFLIESMYLDNDYYTVIVNVDGDVVPLFSNSGEISVTGGRQWTKDDRYVSFPGRRIDSDQTSPTFGQWIDFGLYMVEIQYDNLDGYPLGTLGQPAFVLPSDAVYYNTQSEPRSDIRFHSWADDGLRFVYSRYVHTDRLSVGDLLTQQTTDIGVDPAAWYGGRVAWAPGAERVMCNYVKSKSMVITMNINGSGLTEIASSTSTVTVYAGDWSPTGSHLVYKHQDGWGKDSRIIRATNTGGSKTRITSRSQFGSGPSGPTVIGWRATD